MRQGLNKAAVLKAAAQLADEDGYNQVTLASVAKKLTIRTPSLYNHVEGLPGLKKELGIFSLKKLKEELANAAIGKSGEEALIFIGEAYVHFVRIHPGLYEATMGAPDFLDPDIQAAGNEIVTLLLKVLEPYQLELEDALHTVRGLRSLVHGFATLEMKKGFNIELSTDQSLRFILKTFLTGINARI